MKKNKSNQSPNRTQKLSPEELERIKRETIVQQKEHRVNYRLDRIAKGLQKIELHNDEKFKKMAD